MVTDVPMVPTTVDEFLTRFREPFRKETPTDRTTAGRWGVVSLIASALALVLSGCQEPPPVVEMGGAAEAGGMEFTVLGYNVVRPELTSEDGVYEYAKPVLAVTVRATNTGKDSFQYVPDHGGRQMAEASSPLLYYAPEGEEATLPPKEKNPLKAVVLDEGTLEGQMTENRQLSPGDSVTDRYLFEVPDEESAQLIFSVPPTMHRGDKPVLHRVSYSKKQPEGPSIRQLGETLSLDGVSFTLNSATLEYVNLEGGGDDETGYSTNPLLKVSYSIQNTTDSAIDYRPGHREASGRRPPLLYLGDEQSETVPRVRFSSDLSPAGQIQGRKTIEPGSTLEDFALYRQPADDVSQLRFEFPGTRFERSGLLRYTIPFDERDVPEPPEKLAEKLNEDEDEE